MSALTVCCQTSIFEFFKFTYREKCIRREFVLNWILYILWCPICDQAFTTFKCRGYLAPEYALRGQLTRRADIYSFAIFGRFFSPIMTSWDIQIQHLLHVPTRDRKKDAEGVGQGVQVWRLQAVQGQQTELTKISQQEFERLQTGINQMGKYIYEHS